MYMSSSLNLSLRKQGVGGGDPDFCLATYLWIPGQARNDTIICHTGLDPVSRGRARFVARRMPLDSWSSQESQGFSET